LLAIKIAAVFAVSLAFSDSHAQVGSVQAITIRSSWGGLGKPGNSELTINRENDRFTVKQKAIPAEQIEALLNAVRQPRVAAPQAANLGITSQWLHDHAEDAGRYATYFNYSDGAAEQKRLFRSVFTNDQTLEQRLASVYASFHTDDYPHMRVDLTLSDGTSLCVTSDSQHPFMLPWKITQGGTTTETYNANISHALLELLPSGFTNREALTDEEQYATGLLQEAAKRSSAEGDKPGSGVRWIRSYVLAEESGELGTFCVYEADSPEAIRAHAQAADLPVDEVVPIGDTVIVRPDPAPVAGS